MNFYIIPGLKRIRKKTAEEIQETITTIVLSHTGLTDDREKVFSKSRKVERVEARRIIMYFIKHKTKMSLYTIGKYFGGRDHTTVIHALNTLADHCDTEPALKETLAALDEKISKHLFTGEYI